MKTKQVLAIAMAAFILLSMLAVLSATSVKATAPLQAQVGKNDQNAPVAYAVSILTDMTPLAPFVTEYGKISVSVDGLGTLDQTGVIEVEKPAGSTVRKAYMAAATTGLSSYKLQPGDIKVDGLDFVWSTEITSSISSYNYWGDVTSLVKSKIDTASAGRIQFSITEGPTLSIDGEILVVIFNDLSQTTDNTVVLLFGAQNVLGDTFNVGLAKPIDKTDPNLALDLSLGISFGYQSGSMQFSEVTVNEARMTSWAGGQDDGADANGALLTVGGLDDTNVNPADPYAQPSDFRYDDELYSLLPFVKNGDTAITVNTLNPSQDDNIFFAGLFLSSATAVVGEGILLSPVSAVNPVGTEHIVTAKVQDTNGIPIADRDVTFSIISGPNAGLKATIKTDASGTSLFRYTGTNPGTDVIEASALDSKGSPMTSNQVSKEWQAPAVIIDIKPGCFPNIISPKYLFIPVAILGTSTFDVKNVDRKSLTFGPTGTEAKVVMTFLKDVNGDGRLDLCCYFWTMNTHFNIGDTQGVLNGNMLDGKAFTGTDSVKIVRW